ELLGNQVPHMHWHVIPRLGSDPDPFLPVWSVAHEPALLTAPLLSARLQKFRSALGLSSASLRAN
ncbi:MAG: hypothetical protein OEY57_16840, partial [Nitrospirota bacterium]|nr:hypothetical protein [Nitrospirota bacterium]